MSTQGQGQQHQQRTRVKEAEPADELDDLLNPTSSAGREVAHVHHQAPPSNILTFLEQRAKLLEKVIAFGVQATDPSHWENFEGKPRLNVGGALLVMRRLGIRIYGFDGPQSALEWTKEILQDEVGRYYTYTFRGRAQIMNSEFDVVESVGWASSRDVFLGEGMDPDDPKRMPHEVKEGDILKKAKTQLVVNAVIEVTGLKGMTWERLKAMGLSFDENAVTKVGFRHGAKGGGRGGEWKAPFGDAKGKGVTELSDKDLTFFLNNCKKNLASDNPDKAKYRKQDEAGVVALQAEIDRRAAEKQGGAQQGAPAQNGQASSGGPASAPASRPPAANGSAAPGSVQSPWARVQKLALEIGYADDLRALVKSVTGKENPGGLVFDDVAKVEAALRKAVPPSREPGDDLFDDVPK